MNQLAESDLYEGITVDLIFDDTGPEFGDLFTIVGYENPNFPPPGKYDFSQFESLQFSQIDDYFGIQALSDEGDDVPVWLYPLVDSNVVDHHPGPFTGLRLEYNVIRNPARRAKHYIDCIKSLSTQLPVTLIFHDSSLNDTQEIEKTIGEIQSYWSEQNIEVGSSSALEVDF